MGSLRDGVEQHLVGLQLVGSDHKSAAVRQLGMRGLQLDPVTSVNVVEFGCRFAVATGHSAAVEIWGGNTSTRAGVSSAMASVCM